MSTLGTMKSRIASELRRSDLSVQIGDAISSAIDAYRDAEFAAAEDRSVTFSTVASKQQYTSVDVPPLARLKRLDYAAITQGSGIFRLLPVPERAFPDLSTTTAQPQYYLVYGGNLALEPIPDAVYTVRLAGIFKIPPPSSDGEAGNFWMTEAERLIRSRAKYELYVHVLHEPDTSEAVARMAEATADALSQLYRETGRSRATGFIRPMRF